MEDDDDKRLCPLRKIKRIRKQNKKSGAPVEWSEDFLECLEEQCQWWRGDNYGCAVYSIAHEISCLSISL